MKKANANLQTQRLVVNGEVVSDKVIKNIHDSISDILVSRVKAIATQSKSYVDHRSSINAALLEILEKDKRFVAGAKGIDAMSRELNSVLLPRPNFQNSNRNLVNSPTLFTGLNSLNFSPPFTAWIPANPSGVLDVDPVGGTFAITLNVDPGTQVANCGLYTTFVAPSNLSQVRFSPSMFPPAWWYAEHAAAYVAHTNGSISYAVQTFDQNGQANGELAQKTVQLYNDSVAFWDHHSDQVVAGGTDWGFPGDDFFSLSANTIYGLIIYAHAECYADQGTFGHATSSSVINAQIRSLGINWPS